MLTDRDREARRRWAIDKMLDAHPELTRDVADDLYERVAGKISEADATRAPAPLPSGRVRLRRKNPALRPARSTVRDRISVTLASLGIALAGAGLAHLGIVLAGR